MLKALNGGAPIPSGNAEKMLIYTYLLENESQVLQTTNSQLKLIRPILIMLIWSKIILSKLIVSQPNI